MYIPHDYKMVCDRCGGVYRSSEMRESWKGLQLCKEYCWESRHPQDSIEVRKDDISVPIAYPDVPQTMEESTLTQAISSGGKSVYVLSTGVISEKDPIGILMDNGAVFWSFVYSLTAGTTEGEIITFAGLYPWTFDGDPDLSFDGEGDGGTTRLITLGSPIHGDAASGNTVYLPAINSENWT